MTTLPETRRKRTLMYAAIVAGGLFLFSFVAGFVDARDVLGLDGGNPFLWVGAISLVMAVSMFVGVVWMQNLDELAQRAHYVAWYWGGSMAMAVLGVLIFAIPALSRVVNFDAFGAALSPIAGEGALFAAGIFFSLVVLVAGYGLWWLVYWMRKL